MLRHALVTGASSGLGRELVRQLVLDRGMTVLATARRLDRLESLAAELPEGRVVVVDGDLADPEFRARLWERAEAFPGGLDLLVNNAGLGHYDDFAEQDPEDDPPRHRGQPDGAHGPDPEGRPGDARRAVRGRSSRSRRSWGSSACRTRRPTSRASTPSTAWSSACATSSAGRASGSGRPARAGPRASSPPWRSARPCRPRPGPRGSPPRRSSAASCAGSTAAAASSCPRRRRWAVVALAHWLPGPFDWAMGRWSRGVFGREIRRARPDFSPPSPP